MIIRKPYAFIIKHFRMIHLIILACLLFIIVDLNDIYHLFVNLQQSNTTIYTGAYIYVDNLVYYFSFLGLILSAIVFWLLKEKKKPTILYFALIIYFGILIVCYSYFFSVLRSIQEEVLEIDTIIFVKDISNMVILPCYAFIGFCFVRGIGFNIKQFNFSKDIAELQIADKDSAEFELLIGQNNYKYLRTIRRTIREIKYYILENKFALICIGSGILLVSAGLGFNYYNQYMKKLKASEATSVNGISYTVNKSYISEYDFNGNKIRDGYKYVVVDMKFYNATSDAKSLDLKLITLADGKLIYYPTLTKNSKFYDFGIPYKEDDLINSNDEIEATLTFEIPASVNTRNFTLRVQYDLESSLNNVIARYRNFAINTTKVDVQDTNKKNNLNETINIDTVGKNKFALTITNYQLKDTYNNKYVVCSKDLSCSPISRIITSTNNIKNTMLIIDYKGIIYDDANFTKTFNTYNKIFANYATIKYNVANKEYTSKVSIVPLSDVDGKIFIDIERRILRADSISLNFDFRNEKYTIPLLNNGE